MQDDRFFSDYGQTTVLLIQGAVRTISAQGNETVIELVTSEPTRVLCDVGNEMPSFPEGDTATFRAMSGDAQRSGAAVMFKNCAIQPQ